ncbi:MAG TPA: preprotein translocase subunit SecY [Mycobacteriales bacterium]|nr:preprotein translocase subunit SecY [Mycobacteriales bacterium]
MLGAFVRAFRTPDLRSKIVFTLFIITLFRIGASLPSPGVSVSNIRGCVNAAKNSSNSGVFTLLNLFSGGALYQLSIFALGILPYITSSIILQLLTVVIPRLEELKKQGQAGQGKITQYTRYLTVGLAILQAAGIIALARSGNLIPNCPGNSIIPDTGQQPYWLTIAGLVCTMTAGTGIVMWLGELITDRGVGNGMSILMFSSIAARLPAEGKSILDTKNATGFVIVIGIGLAVIAAVVFIEQAQRRIPVQYARRIVGKRSYGGSSTYLPIKVNPAGVVPVIFASALIYLPTILTQLGNQAHPGAVSKFVQRYVQPPDSWVHLMLYFALVIFFTYFYTSIQLNPTEVADNMKKKGGFVPGIRPGRPTAEYLDYIISRMLLPGSLYLGLVAILPNLFIDLAGGSQNTQNFPFGGTSVLIMVGVGLETVKQIQSQLEQRNYVGFLR